MSTEFERLMRLAEQNTADLQRASLERKRHIGDHSVADGTSEREQREKRRKLELEKRARQREDDEKQRQVRLRADMEQRRRERMEAEKAEESRKKLAQQRQQTTRGPAGQSSGAKGSSGMRVTPGARDSLPNRKPLPREEPVLPKRPAPQRMSYDELMRIASGQAEPPAKRPAKSQPAPQQPRVSLAQTGAVHATHCRQQSGKRLPKPESSKPQAESTAPRRPQPIGSAGIRHTTKSLPPVARKEPPAAGRSVESRERPRAPPITKRAKDAEPAPKKREPPPPSEPRVRKAPEREIDRFGVCAGSAAKRDPTRSARVETAPRSNGRREEQTDRRPADSRTQRNGPVGPRPGAPASASTRQRERSPRRRPSPPPARRRDGVRQQGQKRRYDDESDYDSLDDFVVDDEEEGGSRYRVGAIREMFGVRYHDVNDDDDDDDMEVSTRQLMMEERRSAKLGRQEDEEEERRLEEEERARARRRRERNP
ncbi:hypothetical protein IWW39_004033 [Coemansia spiralis]|uniref:SPT2 chromatin protein n=1 Tax=Coemansia spiralis TaxID=417178 RepID=A0A9W8GI37_9FUNG|nr:hypothetical protein IWW39_004033 [Coemansia spiralis]